MGSHYLTERERREMYLLLILLVSPAFGRPSSDQLDVGADIDEQLQSFISFNLETGEMLDNSNLIEKVVESLLGAEQKLLAVEVGLKTLQYEVPQLRIEGNYFPAYNEAKSSVRKTRQTFREFARRTVTEVRDLKILMENLDNEPMLLKISLDKMKDLMIETRKTLREAKENYNKAVQTFMGLKSSIVSKKEQLEKMLIKDSADHKAWVETVTKEAMEACKNKTENGFLGFLKDINKEISKVGIDIGIDNAIERDCPAIAEAKISEFEAELENQKTITERMLKSGDNFDETIKEAIEILAGEIEQISRRTERVEDVSKNIDTYPEEYLRKFQTLGTNFLNGLDDLKKVSEKFLAQPKDILSKH